MSPSVPPFEEDNMNKQIALAAVMAVAVMLACVAMSEDSDADVDVNGISYSLDDTDKTAEVSGFSGDSIAELVIPATVQNGDATYTIDSIGNTAFRNDTTIESLTIQAASVEMGGASFSGCTSLTTVTANILENNTGTFTGCKSLGSVTLEEGSSFKYSTFANCPTLTSITIGNEQCKVQNGLVIDGTNTVMAYTFSDGAEVTIPDGVVAIGDLAFRSSGAKTVTFGEDVESIGDNAFEYSSVESVVLNEGLKTIGGSAFKNCKSLTAIDIPESVTEIPSFAFASCTSLFSVTGCEGVTTVGQSAFNNVPIESISMPNVTSLGVNAFSACKSLKTVEMPNLKEMENRPFYNNESLTSVTVDESCSIPAGAFDGCTSLKSITKGEEAFPITEEGSVGTWVASIGETLYGSLESAIEAAVGGDTISMLADVSTGPVTIDKGITLDLDGHTLTITGNSTGSGIKFTSGDSKITGGGAITDTRADGKTDSGYKALVVTGTSMSLVIENTVVSQYVPGALNGYNFVARVEAGASLTLNSGASFTELMQTGKDLEHSKDTWSVAGVAVFGTSAEDSKSTELTVNDGASIDVTAFAIAGNGTNNADEDYSNTVFTINGGTITSGMSQAIYHPQNGDLNVYGGTITGNTGIEIRAGSLVMTGGTVIATGSPVTSDSNSNGSTTSGAGIAIVQHTTKLETAVDVQGGTVEGYVAVYESNEEGNAAEDLEKVQISLSGGTLTSTNPGDDKKAVDVADKTGFISGGTFNTAIDEGDIEAGVEMETDSSGNTVAVAPFTIEEMVAVLTDSFKLPITLNKDVEVQYNYDSSVVSYNEDAGFFTFISNDDTPIQITITAGDFSRTVDVYNSSKDDQGNPAIEVSDETVELAVTEVYNPDQDIVNILAEYEVDAWQYMHIYRVDGKTDPVSFTLNMNYDDDEKLFVVHFKDDGSVDYPTVESATGGSYTITPSSFSLFAIGIYTGEGPTPEPTPEPEPEPEPEPTPDNPPAGGDDDEPLPPIIRPGGSDSADDDTVTIVACAAAAAVAAIMAVFLIYAYRKD